jgi:hypothetical protein
LKRTKKEQKRTKKRTKKKKKKNNEARFHINHNANNNNSNKKSRTVLLPIQCTQRSKTLSAQQFQTRGRSFLSANHKNRQKGYNTIAFASQLVQIRICAGLEKVAN